MKIRLTGDSIRFRLSPEEVVRFAGGTGLELSIPLADGSALSWSLVSDEYADAVTVLAEASSVRVSVPRSWLTTWADDDRIGFEAEARSAGASIRVLVEKDLPCRH